MAWEIASETPADQWQVASEKPIEPPPESPNVALDVAKGYGSGLARAAERLPGTVPSLLGMAGRGVEKGLRYLGLESKEMADAARQREEFLASAGKPYFATDALPHAQTVPGQYAETLGEMTPNVLIGPGGVGRRAAMNVVAPTIGAETAGQLTKGSDFEPYARMAGAVVAPSVAGRAITPVRTDPRRAEMIRNLEAEGVDAMTAGQRTGNRPLQYAESVFGDYPGAGQGATTAQRQSNEQFTSAVLRRLGMNEAPTRDNLGARVQEIQNEFERLASRNVLQTDRVLANEIAQTIQRYGRQIPSQQREVIYNVVQDLAGYGGRIPGIVYQTTRSDLGKMAQAARESNPAFAEAARGLRNALDRAMERSLSPQDRGLWGQLREHYGAWKTIEKAAKNTDDFGNVIITPNALKEAASAKDRGNFARGLGRFAELAQSGTPVLKTLPQSGTQPRAMLNTALASLGAGATGAGLWPVAAAIGAPAVAGRVLMNPVTQRYLSNQVLQGPSQSRRNAMLSAYLATIGDE